MQYNTIKTLRLFDISQGAGNHVGPGYAAMAKAMTRVHCNFKCRDARSHTFQGNSELYHVCFGRQEKDSEGKYEL